MLVNIPYIEHLGYIPDFIIVVFGFAPKFQSGHGPSSDTRIILHMCALDTNEKLCVLQVSCLDVFRLDD